MNNEIHTLFQNDECLIAVYLHGSYAKVTQRKQNQTSVKSVN